MDHQNRTEEEANLTLDCLPEEILLHTFKYLNLKDVLNIALTSKLFSRIINENFNILAPKKHRIAINYWNEYRDWIGSRKYSSYVIDSTAVLRFQQIVFIKSHQITKLSLNFHNDPYIDVETVRDILIACENVKEVRVNFTNLVVNNEKSFENLPNLKNLENLDFYGNSKFFKIFMNIQLKVLKLRFFDAKDSFEIFKNFLKKQTKLAELKLFGYNQPFATTQRSIFDDESLEKVGFRLSKFKISRHPSLLIKAENFNKFLLNHQDTLTQFSVTHSEVNMDLIQNFRNLKKLKVERSLLVMRNDNLHIENVMVKKSSIGFIEYLPNLKILKIMESVSFLSEVNFINFRNLESLDIYASHIPRLIIPSVKNLKIVNAMSFDIDAIPFFLNNIQNLSFRNCETVRALLDYLYRPQTLLKSLKIEDSKIEERCLNAIKKNRAKIGILDIKRCQRIANIPIWSYYLCDKVEEYLDQLRLGLY